jgi:microcystin-dependent protein
VTTISQTDAILEGSISTPLGIGSGHGLMGGALASFGPLGAKPTADHDVGDMKMAVRTDDHAEGSMTWMLADGRAINRVTYATLFGIIGVAYGIGDGATTFNIPSFTAEPIPGGVTGRFPVGVSFLGYTLGAYFGAEVHVHNMTSWIVTTLTHTYNPNSQVTAMPGMPTTFAAGNLAYDVQHSHNMPTEVHAAGPYLTDVMFAPAINPYTAVGFFIRVL